MVNESFQAEVSRRERFLFGKNWANFLKIVDEEKVGLAVESLKSMLEIDTLEGKSFLDVGSGSGLFSLAASRLGAFVHSFDFDPDSVACTAWMKEEFGGRRGLLDYRECFRVGLPFHRQPWDL